MLHVAQHTDRSGAHPASTSTTVRGRQVLVAERSVAQLLTRCATLRIVQHMPSEAATVLASRLRQIRGDRSMAEMAELAGVSRQTWFKWESGAGHLPRDLDKLAAALDLASVAELFDEVA